MAAVSPVARAQGFAPLAPRADDALAGLYERHAREVYGFCLKWLRSREEAEDAVQTTFMYAWRGLGRGVVPTSEAAWVLAIARNVCRSATDAGKRRAAEIARDPHVLEDMVVAPTPDDDVAQISEALLELTEQQRRAILMREWQGLSYREIADELGVSQSAVETLIFRARRSLARKLQRVPALAPWMKSLLAGSTTKIAAGATVAVLGVAAGEVATHRPQAHEPAPARAVAARAALVPAVAVPQRHAVPRTTHARTTMAQRAAVAHARAVRPTVSAPPAAAQSPPPAPLPSAPPASAAPAAPPASGPPPPSAAPAPAAAPAAPAQPVDTTPVGGAAGTATDTVNAAVGTATDTVDAAVGTAVDTVAGATSTATNTAQAAVATVTTALPPVLPLHP